MSIENSPDPRQEGTNNSNPPKAFPTRKKAILIGALTFTILASLIGSLAYQRYIINEENENSATYDALISTKEKIEESLNQGIAATETLSFFIQPDGSVQNFDAVAAQIIASNNRIDALQLVPGGVIRYVYPVKENESVLGYNVLADPLRNKEAYKAIQKKEVFYAGPLKLKQGDMGVVGRLPVFRNNKFWGFSAVIIKMHTLLRATGIDSLGKGGYYYQLSKINPDTKKEEFFINNPKGVVPGAFVSINMLNQDWKLSACPVRSTNGPWDIAWLVILGLILATMSGLFVYTVIRRPERLDELVKIRTAELQESEEQYRSLIEQAADGVIVYDFDGAIHHFNRSAYTEAGYTAQEFSKLNLKDLLVEKKAGLGDPSSFNPGNRSSFQRKLVKRDGTFADIEINVNLLSDGRLLAFVRNITRRKDVERALKESEEKFSKAFNSNLLAIAIYDDEGTIVDANETFAAMLETGREQLIGDNSEDAKLSNRVTTANRQFVNEAIVEELKLNGRLQNYELAIETSAGTTRHLLLSIEKLEFNEKTHWLTTAIEVTEKVHAEQLLRQNERKYRALIEQASDGVIITDFKGNIAEVNNSICVMTGYGEQEMIGRRLEDFLPTDDLEKIPLRFEVLLEGKTLLYERKILRKDGSLIDVEVNAKMSGDNMLIGLVRDITERKRAEMELKKSNERFELIALATKDAIWDHDFVTDITVGNNNLYTMYGFDKKVDTIHFNTFIEHVHPDEQQRMLANFDTAVKNRAAFITEEFRFNTPAGYTNIYDRAYLLYDENGRPARIMGVMQDITGRVRGEEAILREKELSDKLINSLPAVFYLYTSEGKFLRWNKNLETVTGYTSAEIEKLHPLDLFHDAEKVLLTEKIGNVFVVGQDNVEANFLTKDGTQIPYYFSGMKIEYEGQICLMGFGLDFSNKARAEKAIKESEQKFRSLVEQASDGVAIISAEGELLYISPAGKRITGYAESEIKAINVFTLTHPDDATSLNTAVQQAVDNPGEPIKILRYRMLHKDGSWRWLENTVTNMMHLPSINGIVTNFRDVTEKVMIEKKIVNEKELSDSIINSLPGIFYLYDQSGKFIRWNKNFETVTGYSPEEIRKMHPLDFYGEAQQPMIRERMANIFTKEMPAVESLLLTKDGTTIPFFYNSLAIEFEGVPSVLGMGFDVTERQKIEQQLLLSHQDLEHKAAQLVSSYAELERFAYIVSHDLQEPLRMVSSFLRMLEKKYKGQLDETAEKYIHFAVDGADRMKQLIMDLLEYSRTGTNKDVATNTNMNEIAADTLRVLKSTIEEEAAEVTIDHLPTLCNTNKLQMFQLMQNLVGNALKYRGAAPPVIHISVQEEPAQWLFSVKDNGIGIDPRFAEKIFIIFQRLHNKTEFSGTGIGLSICKKIVEKHGGKIWVKSQPGEGSTFFFTINKQL
ncbi:MAG: PAS domain S-box protein [Bacteroidota bacterium]